MNNTIFRTMQILQYIGDRKEGTTLRDIVNHFDIPKSSAFVIVQSLHELNYIATMPFNEKSYCLGIEAFTLGIKYFNDLDVVEQCLTFLKPLADKYDKTAFISVLDGEKIVFIGKYVAPKAVLATCALGSRKDVYATAAGKALLAFLPEQERNRILNHIEFTSLTERTINSMELLKEELEVTKNRGYSMETQEDRSISSCCGAPVFDYTGKVAVAVSLSDVYNPDIDNKQVAEELRETAKIISKSLGYHGN